MFVLGIDPGLSRCGYGVVESHGRAAQPVSLGVIRTPPSDELPDRLACLQRELKALIAEFQPAVVAIERVFFQSNVRTAFGTAQAAGLAMVEGVNAGAEVFEYTPNQVKEAVGGWGAADKEQMQRMVQTLLSLPSLPRPADAADAAAVALCHIAHAPFALRASGDAATSATATATSASSAPSSTNPAPSRRAASSRLVGVQNRVPR